MRGHRKLKSSFILINRDIYFKSFKPMNLKIVYSSELCSYLRKRDAFSVSSKGEWVDLPSPTATKFLFYSTMIHSDKLTKVNIIIAKYQPPSLMNLYKSASFSFRLQFPVHKRNHIIRRDYIQLWVLLYLPKIISSLSALIFPRCDIQITLSVLHARNAL